MPDDRGDNSDQNRGAKRVHTPVLRLALIAMAVCSFTTHCHGGFLPSATVSRLMVVHDLPYFELSNSCESATSTSDFSDWDFGMVTCQPDESSYESAPVPPTAPLGGVPGFLVAGSSGVIGGTSGRSLTGQSRVTGAGGAPVAFCAPSSHLPVSMLQYRRQQKEFLYFPDAPPIEVFRPPPEEGRLQNGNGNTKLIAGLFPVSQITV